jgi:hypothetical protein
LISGDVKDDWWLEKDGKRLMPLPQLKKEIFDKAGVDFHIYTADRFLELNKTGKKEIDENTIKEVRKVRELEEKRMMIRRMEMMERERELDPIMFKRYSVEYTHLFDILEGVMAGINRSEINSRYRDELDYMSREIRKLRNRIVHGEINSTSFDMFYKYTKEISFVLHKIIHSEEINPDLSIKLKEYIDRLEYLNQRLRRNI